jgi:protein-tyrosine phosphatase
MADPFRVLFVCTGNVCRSPMAEAMLASALRERLGANADRVEVASAGTGALTGEPMEPFAVDALTGLGVDPGEFVARDVTPELLEPADLILTATRQHRSLVVTVQPSVVRRVFTIKEFARLAASLDGTPVERADGDPGERLRQVIIRVGGQRGFAPAGPPEYDDVRDPFGEPAERFVETARDLLPAVTAVADLLADAARG